MEMKYKSWILVIGFKVLVIFLLYYNSIDDVTRYTGTKFVSRNILEVTENQSNCTSKRSKNFPDDFFNEQQKKSGLIFVHILIVAYMVGGLALVCDRYFMASMEIICDRLQLSEDVAGATFVAIGTSAPELATAVIGVFVTKSDVGVDTVAGSTVYNMFFITALVCLFSKTLIKVRMWPIMRDGTFFTIASIALFAIMQDGKIYWYEGLVVALIYALYIAFMAFSNRIEILVYDTLKIDHRKEVSDDLDEEREKLVDDDNASKYDALSDSERHRRSHSGHRRVSNRRSHSGHRRVSYRKSHDRKLASEDPKRARSPSCNDREVYDDDYGIIGLYGEYDDEAVLIHTLSITTLNEIETGEYKSPLEPPKGIFSFLYWLLFLPISVLFFITIPDCRKDGFWSKLFPITFLMSIVWLSALAYVLIWMVEIIGETFDIPEPIMGITFLAIGSSLPDTFSVLAATKMGYGEMAISSILGSNIFDLTCSGLPWLLETTIFRSSIDTNSKSLIFTIASLLISVVIVVLVFKLSNWELKKILSVLFIFLYVVFLILAILYQLNYFGVVNLPYC